jgi:hypothetical protein
MRKPGIFVLALVTVLTAAAVADAAGPKFRAKLNGANEVPGPGHPTASGYFFIQFNEDFTEARFDLTVKELDGATRAHLHCGDATTAGPIFIHLIGDMPLFNGVGPDRTVQNLHGKWLSHTSVTNQSFTSTTTPCGATLEEVAVQAAAGNVYVNVHTNPLPAGAIRGQLE